MVSFRGRQKNDRYLLVFITDGHPTTFISGEPPSRVHVPNFGGLSGSEDRGGGDNSIQFINFGRVGDKSFEKWRQKIGGWVTTIF